MTRWASGVLAVALLVVPGSAMAGVKQQEVKLDGYAEWRGGDTLVVDGQRVRVTPLTKFKGKGDATSLDELPLGYEVKVKGVRAADGAVEAREIEAKPNGSAMFESELRQAFDEVEREFVRRGQVFEEDEKGRRESMGRLLRRGPYVERAHTVFQALVPPYLDADDYRVYVVENKEWNAMAAPNGAIFVFTGLMDAVSDDELAVVLGHELAHATHEHSRKAYKRDLPLMLGAALVLGAAEAVDDGVARTAVQVGAYLTYAALSSGYGRDQEDQADRTGLRYVYEAGYDASVAPGLWRRFAQKYGDGIGIVNFFFADHSQSSRRAAALQQEVALNYGNPGLRFVDTVAPRPSVLDRAEELLAEVEDLDSDPGEEDADHREDGDHVRSAEEAKGRAMIGFTVAGQGRDAVPADLERPYQQQ
jgi:Zn-dependent protease with chaperone function